MRKIFAGALFGAALIGWSGLSHAGESAVANTTSGEVKYETIMDEALKDATETVDTDFIIVFDADYLPSKGLIRRLMAPFFDPEVGAVMGRVVPRQLACNEEGEAAATRLREHLAAHLRSASRSG